jgi:hypothetical protein
MRAWRRIALVSSLLWIISIPLFLVIETNRQANNHLSSCIARAYRTHEGSGSLEAKDQDALNAREDECLKVYTASSIAPQQVLRLLALKEDKQRGFVLWAFMLIPIIVFWIAARFAIGAVDWLHQVFSRRDAVDRLARTATR